MCEWSHCFRQPVYVSHATRLNESCHTYERVISHVECDCVRRIPITSAARCSVLQCVAVWCSVLQCIAVYCSVVQCVEVCCSVLQCVAVCCSVFQCVAVRRSVLQCVECVAVCCCAFDLASSFRLEMIKGNTLQKTPFAYNMFFQKTPFAHKRPSSKDPFRLKTFFAVSKRCTICSRAGLAPGCLTHVQSEWHHRCAVGEPACT